MNRGMMLAILALASAAMAGCSPTVWTKPGADDAQFSQDKQACIYDAEKHTANGDPFNEYFLAKECMKARGYTNANSAAAQQAPQAPKLAAIRAPGQTLGQLHALEKECAAAAASHADTVACLKRNRVTVIPESEFAGYVKKAVALGVVKQENLKDGMPNNEADRLAVDKLVWTAFGIQ